MNFGAKGHVIHKIFMCSYAVFGTMNKYTDIVLVYPLMTAIGFSLMTFLLIPAA